MYRREWVFAGIDIGGSYQRDAASVTVCLLVCLLYWSGGYLIADIFLSHGSATNQFYLHTLHHALPTYYDGYLIADISLSLGC